MSSEIYSIGPIDPVWQAERKRDIDFTHALLRVAEHLPEQDQRELISDFVESGLVTTCKFSPIVSAFSQDRGSK